MVSIMHQPHFTPQGKELQYPMDEAGKCTGFTQTPRNQRISFPANKLAHVLCHPCTLLLKTLQTCSISLTLDFLVSAYYSVLRFTRTPYAFMYVKLIFSVFRFSCIICLYQLQTIIVMLFIRVLRLELTMTIQCSVKTKVIRTRKLYDDNSGHSD
jgi:hypothetical protein